MQQVLRTTTSAVVEVVGGLEPVGREQARDALRVVLVHLAPEGAHEEAAGPGHDGGFYGDDPTQRPRSLPPWI